MTSPGRAAAALGLAAAVTGCSAASQASELPAPTFAPPGGVVCNEVAFRPRPPGSWVHPIQSFYAPGERAPTDSDLRHLMLMDNAAVVRYRADAPASARARLRAWAQTLPALVVVPTRRDHAPPVEAFTGNRRLTCDGVDTTALTAFADRRGQAAIVPHGDSGGR